MNELPYSILLYQAEFEFLCGSLLATLPFIFISWRKKKMKKLTSALLVLVTVLLCFAGCSSSTNSSNNTPNINNIPTTVSVNSVSLSETELNMTIGEKASISATVSPSNATNRNVTWSSTNTAVADYVNGNIVALGEGMCVIKATSSNGMVASCSVKVEKAPVLAESVGFSVETVYLSVGDSDIFLTLDVLPKALDSYKGTVSSSDNTIVSATYSGDENMKVTFNAKSAGNAIITVTLDGGKSASVNVIVIDPSDLVKINLPSLPKTVSYTYDKKYPLEDHTYARGRIDSIDVELTVIDKNNILVYITLNGTKTYDEDGSYGTQTLRYNLDLYKENDVFCERKQMTVYDISNGQTFSNSYAFRAIIDNNMTPREFTIKLSSYIT